MTQEDVWHQWIGARLWLKHCLQVQNMYFEPGNFINDRPVIYRVDIAGHCLSIDNQKNADLLVLSLKKALDGFNVLKGKNFSSF